MTQLLNPLQIVPDIQEALLLGTVIIFERSCFLFCARRPEGIRRQLTQQPMTITHEAGQMSHNEPLQLCQEGVDAGADLLVGGLGGHGGGIRTERNDRIQPALAEKREVGEHTS